MIVQKFKRNLKSTTTQCALEERDTFESRVPVFGTLPNRWLYMGLTKIRLNKAFSLGGRVVGMVVNYSETSLYHRKVSFAHRPRGASKNGDFDC